MTSESTRLHLHLAPAGKKTRELGVWDKREENVLSFLRCSSPVHICEADLLFIESHFVNFHALFCSLRAKPPPLAHELMKISQLQCGSDFIFFSFALIRRIRCRGNGGANYETFPFITSAWRLLHLF